VEGEWLSHHTRASSRFSYARGQIPERCALARRAVARSCLSARCLYEGRGRPLVLSLMRCGQVAPQMHRQLESTMTLRTRQRRARALAWSARGSGWLRFHESEHPTDCSGTIFRHTLTRNARQPRRLILLSGKLRRELSCRRHHLEQTSEIAMRTLFGGAVSWRPRVVITFLGWQAGDYCRYQRQPYHGGGLRNLSTRIRHWVGGFTVAGSAPHDALGV
jgi:hypothetical protein